MADSDWNLHGCGRNDSSCLRSPEDLLALVEEIGFLPLFENMIPGFSVEERTAAMDWWTDDPASDSWERIRAQIGRFYPGTDDSAIRRIMGIRR